MSAFDPKRTWDHRPTRFVSLTAQQFPRPATFPRSARGFAAHDQAQNPFTSPAVTPALGPLPGPHRLPPCQENRLGGNRLRVPNSHELPSRKATNLRRIAMFFFQEGFTYRNFLMDVVAIFAFVVW